MPKPHNGIKEKLLGILSIHPEGLTITELSQMLGHHRQTVLIYLAELRGAGIIYERRVGSACLSYCNKNFAGKGPQRLEG